MSNMQALIQERSTHEAAAEQIGERQDNMIRRVLQAFVHHEKNLWTGYYYDFEGPRYRILGAWNFPGYFTDFVIEGETISATGVYHGSKGYSESETISFPVAWLGAEDADLIDHFNAAWAGVQDAKEAKRKAAAAAAEQKERDQLAALQEKYGSQ